MEKNAFANCKKLKQVKINSKILKKLDLRGMLNKGV